MEDARALLDALYEDKLSQDFDRVIIVLGDEGIGKSTLMLRLAGYWRHTVPDDTGLGGPSAENVVGDIAWDMDDFKEHMAQDQWYKPVVVHDANRIMAKKKSMHAEQIELEADMFDSRGLRKFVILGYQSWQTVPTFLQRRRAKNVFYVTSRGRFEVYGRSHMDRKVETGEWPQTNFVDTFDDIEGTRTWEMFKDEDLKRKQERISPDEEETAMGPEQVVEDILENDKLSEYVSVHGGNGTEYIDAELISLDYDLSARKSKQAKKLLERQATPA